MGLGMKYDVRIENVNSRPLAVVRRRADARDLARVVPEACGVVWGVIRAQNVAGAGRHVAIYWDGAINLEVGVEMDAPFVQGEVVFLQFGFDDAFNLFTYRDLRRTNPRPPYAQDLLW